MAYHLDQRDNSIVIDGFENGIADSPFQGIADEKNVNIISVPGEASVQFSTTLASLPTKSGTVVAGDAGADTITVTGVALAGFFDTYGSGGLAVTFAGASLPAGITEGNVYFMEYQSSGPVKVKLYSDVGRTALVDITGDGTGTWASVDMGKPMYFTADRDGVYHYLIDANGRVWSDRFPTGGDTYGNNKCWTYYLNTTLTNAMGNGIAYYLSSNGTSTSNVPYLFVFRNALIDYCNLTTGTWTYGWKTMKQVAGISNTHEAFVAPDNVVYFCDESYVGRFFQNTRGTLFDPTNAGTYTFDETALLPTDDRAQSLSFLGTSLMIGGIKNVIYPWDTTSPTYSYPILLAEYDIKKMCTVNTNTFVLVGNRGRVYITNGTQAQLYKKLPDHISGSVEPYFVWGGICSNKNQLYISAACTNNAITAEIDGYGGLWAIDLDTKAIRLTNKLSYGTYYGYATAIAPKIYSASSSGTGLLVGWSNIISNQFGGTPVYGLDTTISTPYTGSQAIIDSDLIPIGTFDNPQNFNRVEYRLSKPMVSGESVTVQYRLDFSQSWTTIFTDTATSTNLPFSNASPVNFKNAQWLQLRVILNSTATNPSFVRIKELRIKL